MKRLLCVLFAVVLLGLATGCDANIRTEVKSLLMDIVTALPGGLKEAKDKVVDPALDAARSDAEEILDAAKDSWNEAFPKEEPTPDKPVVG